MNALAKGYILLFLAFFLQKIDTFAFSFSPAQGKAGDTVTITLNTPLPADTSGLFVYFSPFIKANIFELSANTIKVQVPFGAVSGYISILSNKLMTHSATNYYMTFNSNADFHVTNNITSWMLGRSSSNITSPMPGGRNSYGSAADIDGDGRLDYVTVPNRFNGVSVLRNRLQSSPGSIMIINHSLFEIESTNLPSGDTSLYDVTTTDLNADGKPDIVAISLRTNKIYIYINESTPGNIRFKPVVKLTASTNMFSRLVCGDINNDGKPDIVAVSFDSSVVSMHINQWNTGDINSASFNDTIFYVGNLCRPGAVYGLALSDLDNNGRLDLALANYCNNTISVYRNLTTSSTNMPVFGEQQLIQVARNPVNIALADFNNDGKVDIAVANQDTLLTILQNMGLVNNQVQYGTQFLANVGTNGRYLSGYYDIKACDINGDGKLDIIATTPLSVDTFLRSLNQVSFNLNNSDQEISFEKVQPNIGNRSTSAGNFPLGITVGDFNKDGRPDLLINSFSEPSPFTQFSGELRTFTNMFGFPTSLRKTESTNQLAAGNRLHFYPNPAKTIIQFDDLPSQTEISIYTMYGRMVLTTQVQADKTIDVQYLPIGTYLIKVHTSGQYGVLIKE